MRHQVFIERCRDTEPETARALATAIAERYQIDPEQILGRLRKGRFRVKANLDIAAARSFMSYLETRGALCTIVDAKGEIVVRSAALAATLRGRPAQTPAPAAAPAARADGPDELPIAKTLPPSGALVAPGPAEVDDYAMTLETPLPPPDPDEGDDYESGLSAGFGGAGSSQDLGALGDLSAASSGSLRLSALDGSSGEAKEGQPGPAVSSDADAFLPPEMANEKALELDVEPDAAPVPEPLPTPEPLAMDSVDDLPAASKSSRMPAASKSSRMPVASELAPEESGPSAPQPQASATARALSFLLGNERARFAVGVGLALLMGYVVASVTASRSEESRYQPVIAELDAEYQAADNPIAWNALDQSRADALQTLESRRVNIVITSLIIWLVVAGLFAFVWIRVVNWSRWQQPRAG